MPFGIWWVVIPAAALGWQSGSLAIISKRVGLVRVLSTGGGGDIGLRSPAVRAELNLLKDEGNASWVTAGETAAAPFVAAAKESIKWGSLVGE